jgi:hypothetical protein
MKISKSEIKSFSQETLNGLCKAKKVEEVKEYVKYYFFKSNNPMGTFFYDAYDKKFILFKDNEIRSRFLFQKISREEMPVFDVAKWFYLVNTEHYRFTTRPNKPIVYEFNGEKFINGFSGFLHPRRPFSSYDYDTQEDVQTILDHIYYVWCNGNEEIFRYVEKWWACVIGGRKMKTMLYLKGRQGLGKSIITEFVEEKVLGGQLVHTTNNAKVLTEFNSQLIGKLLLVFEELPSEGANEWRKTTNDIKNIITAPKIIFEEKYKPSYPAQNIISVILNTNEDALCLKDDDRRTVVLDMNEKYIGNHEYFRNLARAMNNKNVGEAFYNWMVEVFEDTCEDFEEQLYPSTETKKEIIIEHLSTLYKYIKEHFIALKENINCSLKDFYEGYKSNYLNNKETIIHVSKLLKRIGIHNNPENIDGHTTRMIHATYEELYKVFEKKGWIHETDEIEKPIEKIPVVKPTIQVNDDDDESLSMTSEEDEKSIAQSEIDDIVKVINEQSISFD